MIIVGIEAANSFVKVKTPFSTDCYLNTLREVGRFEGDLGNTESVIYQIDGKNYVVGESNGISSSGRDDSRYTKEQYLHETLIGIARNVQDEQEITLVTGLPSEDYKKERLAKDVANNLKGSHTVIVGDEKRTFDIKKVHVMLQPLGSLVYRLYDQNGHIRNGREAEKNSKTLVVDIGYGTTDVVHVENMKPIKIEGFDKGMVDAMNYLRDNVITNNPGIHGLPRSLELDTLVRDNNSITTGGSTYNIVEEKKRAYERTAIEIISSINSIGFNIKEYDKVLFTGGGVMALSDYLKSSLEGINAAKLSDSQLANAIGYYTYGVIKFAD